MEKNWDKTNGIEHAVSVRGKRVVIGKTPDGDEVLLAALPIPGSNPTRYALAVSGAGDQHFGGNVDIDGNLNVDSDFAVGGNSDIAGNLNIGQDLAVGGNLTADIIRASGPVVTDLWANADSGILFSGQIGTVLVGRTGTAWQFQGGIEVLGDVTVRGFTYTNDTDIFAPLTGTEAIRLTTQSLATALLPIRNPGYIQTGGNCWNGAGSVFGTGIRLTPIIDTQVGGVPTTYHLEIGDRLGVERWRISEAGVVTQRGNLLFDDSLYSIGLTGATRPLNIFAAGTITDERTALGANTANAFSATNITDAVAAPGATVQVSPAYHRRGHAWNNLGGANETHDWIDWVLPATAAGATSSTWKLQRSLNGAAYVDMLAIGSDGLVGAFSGLDIGCVVVTSSIGITTQYRATADTNAARGVALTAAITAAGAGSKIDIGPGTYTNTGTLTLKAGQVVDLHGSNIINDSINHDVFYINNIDNVTIRGHGILTGAAGYAPDVIAKECGVRISGTSKDFNIGGLFCTGFAAAGVAVQAVFGSGFPIGHVHNITSTYNGWGVYVSKDSEYVIITDCNCNHNSYGMYTAGGNTQISDSIMSYNVNYGLYIDGTLSANHAHGTVTGCYINHNTVYGIYIDTVTLGHTFTGCNIYGIAGQTASIYLKACKDIKFLGGKIGDPSLIVANGALPGYSYFDGVDFAGADPTFDPAMTDAQRSKLVFENCFGETGTTSILNGIGGIGASVVIGHALQNPVSASAGATVQRAPSYYMKGSDWSGAVPITHEWWVHLRPAYSIVGGGVLIGHSSLQFLNSINGAAAASRMEIDDAGNFYAAGNIVTTGYIKSTASYLSAYNNGILAYYGTYFGIANQYAVEFGSTANIKGIIVDGATAVAVREGSHFAFATEGSRLYQGMNASVSKWSVDKDGVYWNAYGSGQSVDAGTLAKILITTLDDDSIYTIEARVEAIDQTATPTHIGVWTGTIVARRIDGTVTIPVDTWTELYDVGADWATTPVSSTAANNLTITTPAAGGAIGTVNWKIFLVRIMKTSSANFTGVTYPMAA